MATLFEIQKQADALTTEEKAGLIVHLIESLPDQPQGPDDVEVARRIEEMDSGAVLPLSHEQFLREAGRE